MAFTKEDWRLVDTVAAQVYAAREAQRGFGSLHDPEGAYHAATKFVAYRQKMLPLREIATVEDQNANEPSETSR